MGRTPCCTKVGLNRGPWTPEEDVCLVNYIKTHGEGGWRMLPKKAGLLRCGKSCRLRWMNYLRPDVKRGHILPEEEDLILRLHRLLGNRWSLIAGRMPGRTDNEIKNYWNTHLSKKLINQGIDPRTHRPLSESEDIWWTPGVSEANPYPAYQEEIKHSQETGNSNPLDKHLQGLAENEDHEQLALHENNNVSDRNMNIIPASEYTKNNFLGIPVEDSGHQISGPSCPETLGHLYSHQKLMQLSMASNCDITSTVRNINIQSTPSFPSYNSRNAALEMALRSANTVHTSLGEVVSNRKTNNNYGGFDQVAPSNFSICTAATPLGALGYGDGNSDTLSWFLESYMNEELNVSDPSTLQDAAHQNKELGSNQPPPQNSGYELWYPSAQ